MSFKIGDLKVNNLVVLRNVITETIQSNNFLAGLKLRVPTLTVAERNALPSTDGLIIHNSDTDIIEGFTGGSWKTISGGSISSSDPVTFTNTSQSTSTDSGALVVTGGAGVGKNLNVGGEMNVSGQSTISDLTQSIDEMSGALIVDGGVGIGKNLFVGEDLNVTGNTTFGGTLSVNTLSVDTLDTSGIVNINDVTNSIDEMSGALVVDGGVGIAKSVNIGETLNVTGNSTIGGTLTVSSANTSSALVVAGGVTLQNDLEVSDNISFGGRITGRIRTTGSSTALDNDFILNVTGLATIVLPNLANNDYDGVTYHIIKETASDVTVNTAVVADKIVNSGTEVTSIVLNGPVHERSTFINNGNRWYLM